MSEQKWQRVLYEKKDGIARILMNRPEVHNAQDGLMCQELGEAFREADADGEVRVIILGGVGKSFTSGHDLSGKGLPAKDMKPRTATSTVAEIYDHELNVFYKEMLATRNVTKPTIAQVQGACIAAGITISCQCDIIIASEDAFFQNPVLRMGAGANELIIEPYDIGVRAAKYFLFTGDSMDAHEAWRLGLVNKVVPRDKLEKEVMRLAQKIALMPPLTIRRAKRSLNKVLDLMGQRDLYDFHFESHILSHVEDAVKPPREEEAGLNLKERLKARDEKFNV